jgi:rare lipoprotein A
MSRGSAYVGLILVLLALTMCSTETDASQPTTDVGLPTMPLCSKVPTAPCDPSRQTPLLMSHIPTNRARVSWYGGSFIGRHTASGAVLTANMMNFAHKSMAFGTRVRFTYHGRSVIAVCNDRGPFVAGRTFDLGPGTAQALGFSGVGTVEWEVVR